MVKMSIRRKLTLMTMAISVIAVGIAVTSVTMYLIYDMRKSKIESVALIAKIAGDRNSAALAFGSKESIQGNLELYRLSPSIRDVCIYTEAGELFGKYQPQDANKDYCLNKFSTLPDAITGLITIKDEIRNGGAFIGYIYVVSDTRDIESYVSHITQISAIATILTLGFIVLTTIYFSRTLSNAILELTSTIQTITSSRNYTFRAKTDYNDEIGILAKSFNAMLGEVLKRDKELALANEKLEEKVLLRTKELMDAKQKAEMANEAKSEFLRNMSHEFRTPLHAILSFSSYGLAEFAKGKREDLKKYFEQIHKGSERLGKLVNEILDFSKLENGTQTFSMQYADLRDLAERVHESLAPLAKDKKIEIHIENHSEGVGVMCDHDKIIQVITNMLSNAIKFTPSNRSITLKTQITHHMGEEMSMLSVIDEGVGIPEDEIEAIFESFRQSSRTNRGAGGTGLGLAICREIISAHQGRIWAENNAEGKGASITFIIPAVSQEFSHSTIIQYQEANNDAVYKN